MSDERHVAIHELDRLRVVSTSDFSIIFDIKFEFQIRSASLIDDSTLVLILTTTGILNVCDLAEPKTNIATLSVSKHCICFFASKKYLAFAFESCCEFLNLYPLDYRGSILFDVPCTSIARTGYQFIVSGNQSGELTIFDSTTFERIGVKKAHSSAIGIVTGRGNVFASASTKGTVIKLFSLSGDSVEEFRVFRRGNSAANVKQLFLSYSSPLFLLSTSDSTTVHIFHVNQTDGSSPLTSILPGSAKNLIEAKRAFATCKIPNNIGDFVVFATESHVVIASHNGKIYSSNIVSGELEASLSLIQ
jgi:hypothetical protein